MNQDKLLCSVVHETTSELESRYLVDHVICRCRKHQELVREEGGFVACFTLDVLVVHLLELVIITNNNNITDAEFAWCKTIRFRSLEFIADRFDNLSFSPKGNDSSTAFVGMVYSGSPSLHAILEESAGKDNSASNDGGSYNFPISQGCNAVPPAVPIIITPPSEGTSVPLTIPMVPQ
jgi:hypothetical protein